MRRFESKTVALLLVLMGIFWGVFVKAADEAWISQACNVTGNCSTLSFEYSKPYCVTDDLDYSTCIFTTLTNSISREVSNDTDLQSAIEWYCKIMLWNQWNWRIFYSKPNKLINTSENLNNRDWQQTFDSHQSLFVYELCSSFEDDEWNLPFLSDWAIIWDVFTGENVSKVLKLQQRSGKKDLCSIVDNKWIPDCEMSIYATEIFSAIMSDVFKIKYAQVFHVDSVEKFEDKETRIMEFLSWYFNIKEEYQNVQPKYPQTFEVIDSNQEFYKKVLKNIKLINNEWLVEKVSESWCPMTWNMEWVDFIACALHWSQWKWMSLDPAFVTLFYNEVMNYNIFITYMQNWFDARIKEASKNKDNEKDVRILQSKSLDLQLYANMQLEAAKQTLYDFEQINMTYPYHIWMLLYQEKVKKFRDQHLSKVVTLFYSLSEKLQNVQIPDEQ